jgi:hypothetical protein
MSDKKAIYDFISRGENTWIKEYLLPIMSQLSALKRDESNGYFFYPLSEENITLNLENYVDEAEEKLSFFEQYFSENVKTVNVPLPVYSTQSGRYKHRNCESGYFSGNEQNERELQLHSPLAEIAKELEEVRVEQLVEQIENIFDSITSKAVNIKDIFLLKIFQKVLEDNLSHGYFKYDYLEAKKTVGDLLLKIVNDKQSIETVFKEIKTEEWTKYLPEKTILVTRAVAHSFNSSSCRFVYFYVIQRKLAEYLHKKLLKVSSKFPEILKDAFEEIDSQLRFQFQKLVLLELIQERYITGNILTPLRLEEVKPFEEAMKSLQEEGYIKIANNKIILTSAYKTKTPEMIRILEEKRQALIREFLNTSVNLSRYLVRDARQVEEQKGEKEQKKPKKENNLGDCLEIGVTENGEPALVPLESMLKHFAVIGKTGTGKTVFGKCITEEAALRGVPSILFDVQGDLARMMMAGNPKEIEANGTPIKKWEQWKESVEVRVYTPASERGIPISINPLKIPSKKEILESADSEKIAEEDLISILESIASSTARLLHPKNDEEYDDFRTFLLKIFSALSQKGISDIGFSHLAEYSKNPELIGFENWEDLIDWKKREKLVKKLNQMMTGLSEKIFNPKWRVEVDKFLTPDTPGKTPVNVIFLNTLEQEDYKKMFMAAILTEIYSWMLAHPSKEKRPQLFLFFDEVGMFAPPDPKQSPPKEMIRLLFKQGRKYGVSCLLCIQNPADIDYKITSQASTRALGAITTAQNMNYIKNMFTTESPELKEKVINTIPLLKEREMVLVQEGGQLNIIKTRWLVTNHGNPLTKDELPQIIKRAQEKT